MSEFWKRKARKYFSVFDLDGDGIIDKKDFIGMAIRFAQIENADKQKAEKLKTEFEKVISLGQFLVAFISSLFNLFGCSPFLPFRIAFHHQLVLLSYH